MLISILAMFHKAAMNITEIKATFCAFSYPGLSHTMTIEVRVKRSYL